MYSFIISSPFPTIFSHHLATVCFHPVSPPDNLPCSPPLPRSVSLPVCLSPSSSLHHSCSVLAPPRSWGARVVPRTSRWVSRQAVPCVFQAESQCAGYRRRAAAPCAECICVSGMLAGFSGDGVQASGRSYAGPRSGRRRSRVARVQYNLMSFVFKF